MYYACMGVSIQIRNVPEAIRDGLAERAQQRGQSMQAYLLNLVTSDQAYAKNAGTFEATKATRSSVGADAVAEIVAQGREAGAEADRSLLP